MDCILARDKTYFSVMRSEMRNETKYQFISTLDHKMELSRSLMARKNDILHMAADPDWWVFPLIVCFFFGEQEDMIKYGHPFRIH